MSPRSWQNRVEDILTFAQNIRDYTDGMSFDDFLEDPKTIRAVAYEFTTIGEAARVIPAEIQERFPDVPWGKMQGICNVLVHEYFRLDEEILWKAALEDIPPLITALEQILQSKG
ncbi:MAG TPA: DUF86 domain-containing protein [Anaerolineales bacterium]|nr:DUF86 domain-containing protein [Anaerolineales bacterium]